MQLNRDLWRNFDAVARTRTASVFTFSLVDIHFRNDDWWLWAMNPRSREQGRANSMCLPARLARELMRATLMLAWPTAYADHRAASLLFGMTPSVAARFADLGPLTIERIAARHSGQVRLR